jgi:hypothetical protein
VVLKKVHLCRIFQELPVDLPPALLKPGSQGHGQGHAGQSQGVCRGLDKDFPVPDFDDCFPAHGGRFLSFGFDVGGCIISTTGEEKLKDKGNYPAAPANQTFFVSSWIFTKS